MLQKQHLVYLAHGQDSYIQEFQLSVLSALYWCDCKPSYQIHCYTDQAPTLQEFFSPHVHCHELTDALKREWMGDTQYIHNIKIGVLQHFCRHNDGKVIFVDTDTCFTDCASHMFQRLTPGQTLMHLDEGQFPRTKHPLTGRWKDKFRQLFSSVSFELEDGSKVQLSPDMRVWNSGVIGLTSCNQDWLTEALLLSRAIARKTDRHTCEQVAFSHVLSQHSQIQTCEDIVTHYWNNRDLLPKYLAAFLRGQLLASPPILPAFNPQLRD